MNRKKKQKLLFTTGLCCQAAHHPATRSWRCQRERRGWGHTSGEASAHHCQWASTSEILAATMGSRSALFSESAWDLLPQKTQEFEGKIQPMHLWRQNPWVELGARHYFANRIPHLIYCQRLEDPRVTFLKIWTAHHRSTHLCSIWPDAVEPDMYVWWFALCMHFLLGTKHHSMQISFLFFKDSF